MSLWEVSLPEDCWGAPWCSRSPSLEGASSKDVRVAGPIPMPTRGSGLSVDHNPAPLLADILSSRPEKGSSRGLVRGCPAREERSAGAAMQKHLFWYGGSELLPQGRCGRHLPPSRCLVTLGRLCTLPFPASPAPTLRWKWNLFTTRGGRTRQSTSHFYHVFIPPKSAAHIPCAWRSCKAPGLSERARKGVQRRLSQQPFENQQQQGLGLHV